MIVFKNYLKILKKYIPMIIIYTVIFIFFAIVSTQTNQKSINFIAEKPDVSIINNDEDTKLVNTLINYISENANIVEIENNKDAIQDALFFRETSYVLIIPKNYTNDLIEGKNPKIETKKTADGDSTYMELILERFLKIVDIYLQNGMNEEQICSYITEDLKQEAKVVIDADLDISIYAKVKQYYNFSNYVFLSLCILIISEIMTSFKKEQIKRKNLIGTTPYKKISLQIFLGNLCVTLSIWLLYAIISIILYHDVMISNIGLLLIINSLVFCITASAIGFLIATLVKTREAINGIVNVVALGLSFISGSFVPQKYLGDTVLGIAKIFPSYWFITNNNSIVELNEFTLNALKPSIINMGIMAIYSVIIFAVIVIYNKKVK